MGKFKKYLEEVKDIDAGKKGKTFEKVFIKGLKLVGLDFIENAVTGPGWDIKTKGKDWHRLIADSDVNIKIFGTKWMISMSELYTLLPWDELPENFNKTIYEKKIKRLFNKKGINNIVFLKPKNEKVQKDIINAVNDKSIEILKKLLIKENFLYDKLGKNYEVRILTNKNKVTSIAIDKNNKVFMRSEAPRKIGGSTTITFRTPTVKLTKKERKAVSKWENLKNI